METFLTGTFQFIVHKRDPNAPRQTTPASSGPAPKPRAYYIAMGFSPDLKTATEMAVRNMITFLTEQNRTKRLSRDDAYVISVAGDVEITQLVNSKNGVHGMCPKDMFTKKKPD